MITNELENGCVVCGPGSGQIGYVVEEAMFRSGEKFDYVKCPDCGTMQIAHVPDDLGRYYGEDYYSFEVCTRPMLRRALRHRALRLLLRLNTAVHLRTGLGRGLRWARAAGIRPSERVLDIGCGAGENLLKLHAYGYRRLTGADPFLDGDREVAPGVVLHRASHRTVTGRYDWILLHHAFEHVPDPRAVLRSAARLLAEGGRVLIRTPVVDGSAWRVYGPDWVQLDAPRHLVVFSLAGLRALAAQEGFDVIRVDYDSTGFQFWGSELVRRGVAHRGGPGGEFTPAELAAFDREAERLNAALDGDQVMVVLRRSGGNGD